jgi:catalase-peroxidase
LTCHPSDGGRYVRERSLSILHTHSHLSCPLEEEFDYAEQFKSLDVEALRRDLIAVMTTSQD